MGHLHHLQKPFHVFPNYLCCLPRRIHQFFFKLSQLALLMKSEPGCPQFNSSFKIKPLNLLFGIIKKGDLQSKNLFFSGEASVARQLFLNHCRQVFKLPRIQRRIRSNQTLLFALPLLPVCFGLVSWRFATSLSKNFLFFSY